MQGDTHMTPYGWGTWGSRSIVSGGGAVVNVAQKVREKILRVAGHLMEVSPTDLEIEAGKVSVKGVPANPSPSRRSRERPSSLSTICLRMKRRDSRRRTTTTLLLPATQTRLMSSR